MQSSKLFVGLACACLVLAFVVPSSATSISILGNSGHGIGDGSGTWNVTSLIGSSNSLTVSLGGGILEQLACDNNSDNSCATPGGGQIDFLFQVPASQIQNGQVVFNNFTFCQTASNCPNGTLGGPNGPTLLPSGVQLLGCNATGGNAPGFLCSGTGIGSTVTATLNGTTLTFSQLPAGVSSFTFLLPCANNTPTSCFNSNGQLTGPTLGGLTQTPEPSSFLLLGTGALAGILKLRRTKS